MKQCNLYLQCGKVHIQGTHMADICSVIQLINEQLVW